MNDLESMFAALKAGDPVFHPSRFWERYNKDNRGLLDLRGLANLKRTVALGYFTWIVGLRDVQFHYLVRHTRPWHWPAILANVRPRRLAPELSLKQSLEYQLLTLMLHFFVARIDEEGLLGRFQEPRYGNPFPVRLWGQLISQDLANSALEMCSIREGLTAAPDAAFTIAELGAGYGRNAWLFLKNFSRSRYIIVDIPPALHVAQNYLATTMPQRKRFEFRPFDSYESVRDEIEAAEIVFLLPHQAAMLPDKSVDLFLNISSLHEMTLEQIRAYFVLIDRLTRGLFYSKQWFLHRNADDGLCITPPDYPVPTHWETLFFRPARVQAHFFESLYRIS